MEQSDRQIWGFGSLIDSTTRGGTIARRWLQDSWASRMWKSDEAHQRPTLAQDTSFVGAAKDASIIDDDDAGRSSLTKALELYHKASEEVKSCKTKQRALRELFKLAEGRTLTELGYIVDQEHTPIARLVHGQITVCAGREADGEGNILDSSGRRIGRVQVLRRDEECDMSAMQKQMTKADEAIYRANAALYTEVEALLDTLEHEQDIVFDQLALGRTLASRWEPAILRQSEEATRQITVTLSNIEVQLLKNIGLDGRAKDLQKRQIKILG